MFHFSHIDPATHPALTDIQNEVEQHPKRFYRLGIADYTFSTDELNQVLDMKCGLIIQQSDQLDADVLRQLIEKGKSLILLKATDFEFSVVLHALEQGAEAVIRKDDDFDLFQIAQFIEKGKVHVLIIATGRTEDQLKKMIEDGATVIFQKDDLSVFAITRLAEIPEAKVIIHSGDLSDFRINKLLDTGATLHFGEGTLISQNAIKGYVEQFPDQIQINKAHYADDLAWVDEMEGLGAVVV